MLKLSAKAANNLVIFAVLLMMLLFNLEALLPQRAAAIQTRLVAEDARVLKITQGNYALERVGEQFRWRAPVIINQDPYQMLAAWYEAELEAVLVSHNPSTAESEVLVWQAGQSEASSFLFWSHERELFVTLEGLSYRVTGATLDQLLPWSDVVN